MKENFKLVEIDHGEKKVLTEGTLENIVTYLKETDLFSWVANEENNQPPELSKTEMPNLNDIKVLRDLENELKKIDLSWWCLKIEV